MEKCQFCGKRKKGRVDLMWHMGWIHPEKLTWPLYEVDAPEPNLE